MKIKTVIASMLFFAFFLVFSACENKEDLFKSANNIKGLVIMSGAGEDSEFPDTRKTLLFQAIDESNNFDIYYIAMQKKGKELKNYVGATVSINGKIKNSSEGFKTLYVTSYEVLDLEKKKTQNPKEQNEIEEELDY